MDYDYADRKAHAYSQFFDDQAFLLFGSTLQYFLTLDKEGDVILQCESDKAHFTKPTQPSATWS